MIDEASESVTRAGDDVFMTRPQSDAIGLVGAVEAIWELPVDREVLLIPIADVTRTDALNGVQVDVLHVHCRVPQTRDAPVRVLVQGRVQAQGGIVATSVGAFVGPEDELAVTIDATVANSIGNLTLIVAEARVALGVLVAAIAAIILAVAVILLLVQAHARFTEELIFTAHALIRVDRVRLAHVGRWVRAHVGVLVAKVGANRRIVANLLGQETFAFGASNARVAIRRSEVASGLIPARLNKTSNCFSDVGRD